MTPYYMGVAYIVIEKKDHIVLQAVGKNVIILTLVIILIIILTSWFLVRLILKPIRNNLKLVDRFIKDEIFAISFYMDLFIISLLFTISTIIYKKSLEKKINDKLKRI